MKEYKIQSMSYKPQVTSLELRSRGFTLIELVVSIGILALVMSFAGLIFRVSIDSQRFSIANAEIMQKLRAITTQLNADFKGLRKDGEIFIAWVAKQRPNTSPNDPNAYERFDRIMFFADGDFQSYKANPIIRGNIARISYMLAKSGGVAPLLQSPEKRILARTQHIMTADPNLPAFFDPNSFTIEQWGRWHNWYEYDRLSLQEWKTGFSWAQKSEMLSVISNTRAEESIEDDMLIGAVVNPADPDSIHMLLCEGVDEFKVQGWYQAQQRWVPEVDPDGNGDLTDTDFVMAETGGALDPELAPVILYPYVGIGIRNINYPLEYLDEAHFSSIPGLGRALKFTFTLYDSKDIIKKGRTFTHIVYLD
jgi:prepilin-type N-terminal cleavage/methylation domain-containing protein